MKKRNKFIGFLLAFGLVFSLCACSNAHGADLRTSHAARNEEPAPSATVDVGEYARVWVSADCTLDLTAGTLTGYSDFEVTGVTGEKAEAVIACTAGGNAYTLSLNADGALEMKSGETVEKTFLVVPSAFSGAWKSSDTHANYYYTVSDTPNADGKFDWATVNLRVANEHMDDGHAAVTKFGFTESGTPTLTFVERSPYGYELIKIYNEGAALKVLDYLGDVYDLTAYDKCFDKTESYFDANGNKFSFDGEQIVFNDTAVAYTLTADERGSGLAFQAGGGRLFLQYCPDGLFLATASEKVAVAVYDPQLIVGTWTNEDGTHTAVVTKDDAITFDSTQYPLSVHAASGGFYYSFTVGSETYTVHFIDGIEAAFEMKKDDVSVGYYILNTAKALFVGTYTDNIKTFTIGNDYAITYEGGQSQAGGFTYLPDFECVAYCYGEGASKKYLVLLDDDFGAFGMFDSEFSYEGAYYTDGALDILAELFTLGLESETDVFTTGGTSPKTLTFDFASGELTYGGKTYNFFYDYQFGEISNYPVIGFFDMKGQTITAAYSVSSNGYGLFLVKETLFDEAYVRLISQAVYEDLLGATFIYHGAFFDETVRLDTDGKLYVDFTDYTTANSAVTATECSYGLERGIAENGKELISIIFPVSESLEVYINIWDRQSASITDIYYARSDFDKFVGSYRNGTEIVTLKHDGSVTVNGTAVTVTAFTPSTESLTVKYTVTDTEYTAVFTETELTITATAGTPQTYAPFAFDTDKFVGTYVLGEDEIVVTSAAMSVNIAPTLTVTFNGESVTATLSVTADGKQQLSFSVLSLPSPPSPPSPPPAPPLLAAYADLPSLPPPPPGVITYTLTLDGNTVTVSDGTDRVTKDAAKWSYADFVFGGNMTVNGKTLTCLQKENGAAPLFICDNGTCTSYTVNIAADGTKTLTVSHGIDKMTLTSRTVTYNSQGGSAVASTSVASGGAVTKPADPTKSGYVFGGWYREEACTTAWDFATDTVTANTTLYAKWVQAYTVTFDAQGGSAVASANVTNGNKVTKPTDPTRDGYTFGGWYKEAACTTAWNFETDTVTANTTLYAKWTENSTPAPAPAPSDEGGKKSGCGSSVMAETSAIVAILMLAVAAVVVLKKKASAK